MNFVNIVLEKRSIRKYKPDPLPEEKLHYVLEAACLAPSGGNRQCWTYIVVMDEALRKKIVERTSSASPCKR